MEEKPKINSLDRFRKQSPRLVLEQYSHCEVPAGCGGIVFRWRHAARSVPLMLSVYARADYTLYIDGVECAVARADLTPGRHVLGLRFAEVELANAVLIALGQEAFKDRIFFRSEADGTWQARATEPAGWDDPSGWVEMAAAAMRSPGRDAPRYYTWYRCNEQRAAALGVPKGHGKGPLWVRRAFEVEAATK